MEQLFYSLGVGVAASFLAGVATGVGALGIFAISHLSDKTEDVLLSVAAGIMLAATFFSLLLPGIAYAEAQLTPRPVAVLLVSGGLFLGAVTLFLIHRYLPHEHFLLGKQGADVPAVKRIWLFVMAITVHNVPEGMAVGVGFGDGDVSNGISLALGIGLQNMPEGLAVAVSLFSIGYTKVQSFSVALLTGLVEPVGGLVGSAAAWLATSLLPWTLGFAAGAMLFVISGEIIPETHRGNSHTTATFSLLGGVVAMMLLDALFA